MRITYIGHATLLIEIGGRTFLTDPNFDQALGGVLRRVSPPGIPLHELPHIDAVIVTHAHADHLSFASLAQLPPDTPVIAPPPVARWLNRLGYRRAEGLTPGAQVTIDAVRVTAAEATHKGHRYGVDMWRSATNMYLFDTNQSSCFFAGDTALVRESTRLVEEQIAPHGRRLDMALLPIGHAPWWKLAGFRKGHLTTEDALSFFERLEARYLIPYHWGTFDHVTSKAHDAIDRLRQQLPGHARNADVRILEPGMSFEVPAG